MSPASGELPDELSPSERLEDALDYARKFMEGWKDRPTLKGSTLPERSAAGRLHLLVRMQRSRRDGPVELLALFHGPKGEVTGEVHDFVQPDGVLNRENGLTDSADHDDGRHFMFVEIPRLPQVPKRIVLRLIAFERERDLERRLPRGLFFSPHSGFQYLGTLLDRKGVLALPIGFAGPRIGGFPPEKVQGGTEIVDRIPGDRSPDSRNRIGIGSPLPSENQLPVLRIVFREDGIGWGFDEELLSTGLEITDVLFGPFDLDPGAHVPVG